MTNAQTAAAIRNAYKALGWSSRDISVRAHDFSGCSQIMVTIKNAAVPFDTVQAIAKAHECIGPDFFKGGSRFVEVMYGYEAIGFGCQEGL